MDRESYDTLIGRLRDKHQREIDEFNANFAKTVQSYEVGDIIRSGRTKMIVDRVSWGFDVGCNGYPQARYEGRVLTEKGAARKDGRECTVYQPFARLVKKGGEV